MNVGRVKYRKLLAGSVTALLFLSACGNAQPTGDLIPGLQRLAASNNPEAIYHLGMAYQTGLGLPKDPGKALEAFRRAASLGDVLAAYKVGCYYDGQGDLLKPDPELALRYKLVAANAGYALAQQDVASLYAQKGDTGAALAWLDKATGQGWSGALATSASVYNGAPGVTPDKAKTAAYFQLYLDRTDATDEQRAWLKNFEQQMSPEEQQRSLEIVRSYRPAPTQLTIKALSGQRAAFELIARRH
ncbi:MAG: tetratricopeptide repeat protein [Pseudomonadota bacterium]